jgi:hypothetical protein
MQSQKNAHATTLSEEQFPLGSQKSKRLRWKKIVVLSFMLILVISVGTSIYYYRQYNALRADPNLEAQRETARLVLAVGKFMELPADETPTVATIQDKDKLKDQPFFAKAENGDKLLAYTKAMKAILYRPSTNKIIEVAPIYINQPEEPNQLENVVNQQEQSAVTPPAGLKIAYYNGTETQGLSTQVEETIKATYPNYQTSLLTNATKKDYQETLVVDLIGTYGKEADEIASLIGGKTGLLPEGEILPDGDILIISGE